MASIGYYVVAVSAPAGRAGGATASADGLEPLIDVSQLSTPSLLGGLAAAAALVVLSGVKLTRYGDSLGDVYNLSKTWVGAIVLAMITSLPELVVTLSSPLALAVPQPQFAMSNVCGSNLINLCIFVVLDLFAGPFGITARLRRPESRLSRNSTWRLFPVYPTSARKS